MPLRTIRSIILLIVLLTPLVALADVESVSLKEAVTQALTSNRLLRAAQHEKSAADFAVAESVGTYLPRLTLEESGILTNSPTRAFTMQLDQGRFSLAGDLNHPATTGDFRTVLTLEQPLFDRRLSTGLAIARNEQEQRELILLRRREEVALRTIDAYLDLQKAKQLSQVAADAVKAAREHLRLAEARSGAGVGLKSDELRGRTFAAEADQLRISAENRVQLAMLRLAHSLGRNAGERVDIREQFRAPAVTGTQAEFEQLAMASRLELKEQQKGQEKADLGVSMARSAYWPTVQGMASYELNDQDLPFGRDNDAWLVGATLRWELFDGRQTGSRVERASALRRSAAEYLADTEQQVRLQVAENFLNRMEIGQRLEVARHGESDAAETMRLLVRRYENSLALMVEVLDAQEALNRARSQVAEMEAEYARSTAQLLFAAGVLLKEVR